MEQPDLNWMKSLQVMLGAVGHGQVQPCSISSVTNELRGLHRNHGACPVNGRNQMALHEQISQPIRNQSAKQKIRGKVPRLQHPHPRLGYHNPRKLWTLVDFMNNTCYSNYPILRDKEKMVSVLNDITMLENQIPYIVLKKLYRKVFLDDNDIDNDHCVANIVCKAFSYPEVDNSRGFHLLRCAARLRATGITMMKATNTASARHKLVDWFDFEISFDVLQIRRWLLRKRQRCGGGI
ncbi:hypothetical protein CR513_00859, partial [Mucuna pruriens]